MSKVLVIGYGPVGAATVSLLAARGEQVVVGQRQRPAMLPEGVSFAACDARDLASLRAATEAVGQIVLAIGLPYRGPLWRDLWPQIMANVIETAAGIGARVVFVDNLYMYGPQNRPLVETMPLSDLPVKPAARAAATRIWRAAIGRVRFAALRGPDFYGPGVAQSLVGATSLGALARGKAALWINDPDMLHDIAYVPDYARAVVNLLDAPDDAFGQAWHVPCAPTRRPRELLDIAARALGVRLRIRAMPLWALRPLGLFAPEMRELAEMRFQWDRPYLVDASKFKARFWSDPTPFDIGIPLAARSFAGQA
ncbi:MAG: NAD-dependent epimerase/dehydratase family protein [Hyphomicrobiales bacterium]|nr:NAD-dependent epimerase/dehydratase family protein [Hyphomicrobiales bacterium]